MADVFLSYSRIDRERVQPIADRLASLGYTTFWDKPDHAGSEAELDAARVVITAWSRSARNSTWVYAETSRARDASKLLQVRLDAIQPPAPFDAMPVANLSGDRVEWGPLEATLALLLRDGANAHVGAVRLGLAPTSTTAGAPKLLTIALVTSLLAFGGALSGARNGVMTADQMQLALTGMLGVGAICAALSLYRLMAIARAGA